MLNYDEFMACPMLYQNHCMHRMNQGQVVCPYASREFEANPYTEEYSVYSPAVRCVDPQSVNDEAGSISNLFRSSEDIRIRKVPINDVTE